MMRRFAEQLNWIDSQRDALRARVVAWSAINSGSHHLAGLERMAAALGEAFGHLGGELRWIDLTPAQLVDATGKVIPQPLGRALQIVKRPQAPRRALLAIHYDTVYG